MTYYEILEVAETASDEVIRMAYKALAKKYHPDVFKGDPKIAEEKMKQINTAYEVLSDAEQRRKYDSFLHSKRAETRQDYQEAQNASESKPKDSAKKQQAQSAGKDTQDSNYKYPSGAKSGAIIAIFLFLSFSQVAHPYIENEALYDYAMLFGFVDFIFVNLIMMAFPMFAGVIKRNSTPKYIKWICAANSIAICLVSLLLYILEVTAAISVGWIIAVLYYFINKHILLQIQKANPDRKKSIIVVCIVCLVMVAMFIGGVILSNSFFAEAQNKDDGLSNTENTNENSTSDNTADYYVDEDGNQYYLEDGIWYVGVRTISLADEFTAEFVYALWEQGKATEESMIAIMDEYGAEQGGGKLYLIEQGDFVDEIDEWCFSTERMVGDVAIIENPYGYSICYISEIFRPAGASVNNSASRDPYKEHPYYKLAKIVANDYKSFIDQIDEIGTIVTAGNYSEDLKKEKVIDHINNLSLEYGQRIILFRIQYMDDNTYNSEIVDYLNERDDVSYEEMVCILEELGFAVFSDGTVKW